MGIQTGIWSLTRKEYKGKGVPPEVFHYQINFTDNQTPRNNTKIVECLELGDWGRYYTREINGQEYVVMNFWGNAADPQASTFIFYGELKEGMLQGMCRIPGTAYGRNVYSWAAKPGNEYPNPIFGDTPLSTYLDKKTFDCRFEERNGMELPFSLTFQGISGALVGSVELREAGTITEYYYGNFKFNEQVPEMLVMSIAKGTTHITMGAVIKKDSNTNRLTLEGIEMRPGATGPFSAGTWSGIEL